MVAPTAPQSGPACPLCGDAMRPWLLVPLDWRRPASSSEYALWWCDRDAYGALWPQPDARELQAAYELAEYFTHRGPPDAAARRAASFGRRLLAHLAWRLDRSQRLTAEELRARLGGRPRTICDLGCGDGSLLAGLAGSGHELLGVEPDPTARAIAAQRGVCVFDGTADHLPAGVPRAGCDVVILQHTLEHCRDPLGALAAARSIVKPDGIFYCEVPNLEAIGARLHGAAWYWLDPPRHLHFFTPASLLASCERTGWSVISTSFDGYCRQFEPTWLDAERRIRDIFRAHGAAPPAAASPWRQLLLTACARPERKYDSVRIEARPA